MTATPRRERLHGLDAIRGLAALIVLLFHVLLRYPSAMRGEAMTRDMLFPGIMQADVGVFPVLCFFIISGFVIAWTIDRSRRPMDFVVSRASRIYPAYWVAIAISVAIALTAPLPFQRVTVVQVLINLTMAQAYVGVPDVSGVFWSLAIELMFYAYALTLFSTGLWPRVHWFVAAWLAMSLAYAAGLPLPWRVSQVLLLQPAPLLAGGMMLYRLWQGQTPRVSALLLAVCGLGVLVSYRPLVAAICFLTAAAIATSARGGLSWLAAPPLIWLGGISYSLYLSHEQVSYVVMRAVDRAGLPHGVGQVLAIVLALTLGWAMTQGVEQPAMRAIRGAWRRVRPEQPAAGVASGSAVAPAARPATPGSPG